MMLSYALLPLGIWFALVVALVYAEGYMRWLQGFLNDVEQHTSAEHDQRQLALDPGGIRILPGQALFLTLSL